MSDAEFARSAAEANLAEVKLGNLAEQQGTTQTIKDFGKRMVTDHSQCRRQPEVRGGVQQDRRCPRLSMPRIRPCTTGLRNCQAKLSIVLTRYYMVRDHRGDVAEFRHEANDGEDAAIKTFASNTLPTLETHLKLAREMYHSVSAQKTSESKGHSGEAG